MPLFVGRYVAAWLAGVGVRIDGLLHGLLTWGVATLLTIYLLTSAIGGIIGGGFSKAVQTAKNAADASASAAATTSFAAFGMLLLGGIAAAVGGLSAVQRRLREAELVVR